MIDLLNLLLAIILMPLLYPYQTALIVTPIGLLLSWLWEMWEDGQRMKRYYESEGFKQLQARGRKEE